MKLRYEKKSDLLELGQYKGRSIGFVLNYDVSYLEWCLATITGFSISDRLQRTINKITPEKRDEQRIKRMKKRKFKRSSYEDDF